MRVLGIVVLTLLISFLLFVASVYITFKYILTPERIKNYLESYIEQKIDEKVEEYKVKIKDKVFSFNYDNNQANVSNVKPEDISKKIKEFVNIKDMKLFNNLNDIHYLSSQLFSNINMKMELLKYRINEYLSNKGIKEEKNV